MSHISLRWVKEPKKYFAKIFMPFREGGGENFAEMTSHSFNKLLHFQGSNSHNVAISEKQDACMNVRLILNSYESGST